MVSQTLEILRQGVWASFTGGWFYDPELDHFGNVFHLYLWLFLLCLPLALHLCFAPTIAMWTIYCILVAAVFVTLKLTNARLHHMYDTGEKIEVSSDSSSRLDDIERADKTSSLNQSQRQEEIEMAVLNRQEEETPPVQCSSRNSFSEGPNKRGTSIPHVDSMELLNRFINSELDAQQCGSTIDLQVDVHHRDSSGSSGADSVQPPDNKCKELLGAKDNLSSTFVNEIMQQVNEQSKKKLEEFELRKIDEQKNKLGRGDDPSAYPQESATSASSLTALLQGATYLPISAFSLSSISTSDVLLKGTGSVELGFMSQDPSVRAAELARGRSRNQQRAEREKRVVRRARSELETCPEKSSPSIPPSHPVSLEIINRSTSSGIGIPCRPHGTSRPSLSDTIKPIVELSDEQSDNGKGATSPSQTFSAVPHSLVRHRSLETSYRPDSDVGSHSSRTWSTHSRHSVGVPESLIKMSTFPTRNAFLSRTAPSDCNSAKNTSSSARDTSVCSEKRHSDVKFGSEVAYLAGEPLGSQSSSDASSPSSETLSISLPDSNDSYFTLIYRPAQYSG